MGIGVAEEEARRHITGRKSRNSKPSYKSIRSTVKQPAHPDTPPIILQNGGQLGTTHIRFDLLSHGSIPLREPREDGISSGRPIHLHISRGSNETQLFVHVRICHRRTSG
jgi:hypothetical protein